MSTNQTFSVVTAPGEIEPDSHFFFRGKFSLATAGTVKIKLLAASWFEAWLDNTWLTDGPARFDRAHPEFQLLEKKLSAGEHVLALHVHYEGVTTRMLEAETPMFVYAEVEEEPIEWHCLQLDHAYRKTGRRIDCILGWIEWCRTDKLPIGWNIPGFDDLCWSAAVPLTLNVESLELLEIAECQRIEHKPDCIGSGTLVNMSTFRHDPTAGFVSRLLDDDSLPAQGRWFRFDLGKVRLGRVAVTLSAPAGTVVQVAYAGKLTHGRVSPYISSSAGDAQTCNLDHFVLYGGRQVIRPLHPKGPRFFEVHVFAEPDQIIDFQATFEERAYYGEEIEGSFFCSDKLLNRIWLTGVETLRSCAEDAITDNPTRERGQWLGDAVGAGMDVLACSYADMRPLRRGLFQAAQCAGDDGMIPAVFPGTRDFLPSFALQWVAAIPHYVELSGDFEALERLYPAAVANIRCFDGDLNNDGLCMNPNRWNFVDWGYRGSSAGFTDEDAHHVDMDPALSLFYWKALRELARWAAWMGNTDAAKQWESEELAFREKVERFLDTVNGNPADWAKIGFHSAALALGSGLLRQPKRQAACATYIKQHILSCFPNRTDAPRLYDTTVEASQLITPFFMHHVFPALIEHGEMKFVLDQFRVCWGHWLEIGLTTWPEVFDLRWSHCHQWSACPTWLLSRYALGLHPRFDLGQDHYDLRLEPGELEHAAGTIPVPYSDKNISVSWEKTNGVIEYTVFASSPIVLHLANGEIIACDKELKLQLAVNE